MTSDARLRMIGLMCLGVATSVVAGGAALASSERPGAGAVPSSGRFGELHAVSTVSGTDAWAVGFAYNDGFTAAKTLTTHWDGDAWVRVPSPNPHSDSNEFNGVSADSATDAWAVGTSNFFSSSSKTLVEHWDGAAWTAVNSPNPGGVSGSYLNSVSATSPTDVWAVGGYVADGSPKTLIEHWDGVRWRHVPSLDPGSSSQLYGVTALSPSDVWAVGAYSDSFQKTLVEHWDGTSWTQVDSPTPGRPGFLTHLSAVSARSSSDVWAVGAFLPKGTDPFGKPLIEHWDGTAWEKVPSPTPGGAFGGSLEAISVTSRHDAWAVGFAGHEAPERGLIQHWDGTSWSVMRNLNPPGHYAWLTGVVSGSPSNATTVGFWAASPDGNGHTLTEQWDGSTWTIP